MWNVAIFVVLYCGDALMRTLTVHFPPDALPTLDTFFHKTKAARPFRRAQAVRAVVTGQRLQPVAAT